MKSSIIKAEKVNISKYNAEISISVHFDENEEIPRISACFYCDRDSRIIPMKIKERHRGSIKAYGNFDIPYLFNSKKSGDISVSFLVCHGNGETESVKADKEITFEYKKPNSLLHFIKCGRKERAKIIAAKVFSILFLPYRAMKVKKNRVAFVSNRDNRLTGNIKAVFYEMTKIDGLEIIVLCKKGGLKKTLSSIFKFFTVYATSAVVFVDDYYHLISYVKKKDDVTLIQLWHACGAFKTFGFSRLERDSALKQSSPNHRQYDYVIASSQGIAPYYAEGFGISADKVLPLGSPRCDVLENNQYKESFKTKFYDKYEVLKDKKLILFAPTFRGGGQGNCFYPAEKFETQKILDSIDSSYCIGIKMHPYLREKIQVEDKYKGRFFDFTNEYDINDLLLVSDLLITDYSSVIFEASVINLPMLFFAFDLDDYVKSRDFYCNFENFVPGHIVTDTQQIISAINSGDYKAELVAGFKQRYFGKESGNATKNVVEFTKELIKK